MRTAHDTPEETEIVPPSWALFGAEPLRALIEYGRLLLPGAQPPGAGDGHPVIVFPGLASDQRATAPLVAFCRRLGYAARDWGRGFNTGPRGDAERWLDELAEHIETLTTEAKASLTLVGWSLGGIYAREVAKLMPRRVRQVITIGTPLTAAAAATRVGWLYRLVNGRAPALTPALARRLACPPAVPTTSIYSRSDGVVAWQACLLPAGARRENVEVGGSHCGMAWNPDVLAVVAERLAQPEGAWRPYADAAADAPTSGCAARAAS